MLEIKIEALTAAIERLIVALDKPVQPAVAAPAPSPEPSPAPEPAPAPVASDALNRTALQSKCLTLVKANRSHKGKIVELIAKHSCIDGGLIADIPDDALQAFADELGAL
jgi:hypothetical protein